MGNTAAANAIAGCGCADSSGCCRPEPPPLKEGVRYKFAPAAVVLDSHTVWDDVDIAKDVFEEQTVAGCAMSEDALGLIGAGEAMYAAFSEGDQTKSVTVTYQDGSVYIGQICRGLRDGHGIWSGAGAGSYEGQWRSNRRSGKGRRIWADGQVFEGDFVDGRPFIPSPAAKGQRSRVFSMDGTGTSSLATNSCEQPTPRGSTMGSTTATPSGEEEESEQQPFGTALIESSADSLANMNAVGDTELT